MKLPSYWKSHRLLQNPFQKYCIIPPQLQSLSI
jgi:hypothetical protein